jgi:hypothetical protein
LFGGRSSLVERRPKNPYKIKASNSPGGYPPKPGYLVISMG